MTTIDQHRPIRQGRMIDIFMQIAAMHPRQTLVTVALILLASVVEGIGIGMLLPLLEIVIGEGGETASLVSRVVHEALTTIGLTPTLATLLVLVVLVFVGKSGLLVFAMWRVGKVLAAVAAEYRMKFVGEVMLARWNYLITQPTGLLVNALVTETQRAAACYQGMCRIIASSLQTAVYLSVGLLISWPVTLAAVAVGSIGLVIFRSLILFSREAGQEQTTIMRSFTSRLIDGLQGMKPLKAMGAEDRLAPLLAMEIENLRHVYVRQVLYKESLKAMQGIVIIVALALGYYVIFQLWDIRLAVLAIMAALFLRSTQSISDIQRQVQGVAPNEAAYWYLRALRTSLSQHSEKTERAPCPSFKQAIEVQNLSFSHPEKTVLHSVSLTIPFGAFVALSGRSGEGKTTLADVIIGLLRPQAGVVAIDGRPLVDEEVHAWRQTIGYVPQETFLFHDTILHNVTLGDEELRRAEVEAALAAAGAWEFVSALPEGVDTVVGERGAKLSGGQRQRIAIARALVRKPKLLVLDEATTGLDNQTEAEILQSLQKLKGDITILAISHQPAVTAAADIVYRVVNGTVVEEPRRRPEVLLAQGGTGG